MWIARDYGGGLYLYCQKPEKDEELGIWVAESSMLYEIEDPEEWMFKEVRWTDDEPTEIILNKK